MKNKIIYSIWLYIIVAIVPAILGSILIIHERAENNFEQVKEEAEWVASIHESHWSQFIHDTITSLEMLALTAQTLVNDYEQLQPLLEQAQASDRRYSGLYLLSPKGEFITGTNRQLQLSGLDKADFTSDVEHTKDVSISPYHYYLQNGQKVISLSVPILDNDNNLLAVIVSLLRIDSVENILNILTPEAEILLINHQNETLLKFNLKSDTNIEKSSWISLPLERIPWMIKVRIKDKSDSLLTYDNLRVAVSIFVTTHILFLFIKYMLLKQQATIEKRENAAQKLQLVGSLAASTAHEIRNPLTGIKGLVQLLEEKYQAPEDQFYFSVIKSEIERINQITSEFLILGKPTAQTDKIEDLSSILADLEPLIKSEAAGKGLTLLYNLPMTKVQVLCGRDQMKQVILNLAKNAIDALDEGGTLAIQLSTKEEQCELILEDNGVGIGKEQLEKIFEPFYTTKETGTGLGLIICQRIIQSFGGEIQISSKEKKGTTVKILLPIATEE